MQGARKLIREARIDVVTFEFCHHHVYTRTFMKDFLDLLPGWTFYRILPHGTLALGKYVPQNWELFDWQNIVATALGQKLNV